MIEDNPTKPELSRSQPSMKDRLANAYGDWIPTYDWTGGIWATLTFNDKVGSEVSECMVTRWIHRLNQAYFGTKRYKKKGLGVNRVVSYEFTKGIHGSPPRRHAHCIVGGVAERLEYNDMKNMWLACGAVAGWSKIQALDNAGGAAAYCAKYVSKEGIVDLWVNPDRFKALRGDRNPVGTVHPMGFDIER